MSPAVASTEATREGIGELLLPLEVEDELAEDAVPRAFLLPSHAEAEGLGIGLHCHGVGDTQVDHRRWLLLPLLLLLLLLLLLPMRSVFLSR